MDRCRSPHPRVLVALLLIGAVPALAAPPGRGVRAPTRSPAPTGLRTLPAVRVTAVREHRGGTLHVLEQGDARVPLLTLRGDAALRGEQRGALIGGEVRRMIETLGDDPLFRAVKFVRAADRRRLEANLPADLKAEAAALARVAGLRQEQVLFMNVVPDLFKTFACSAVVADEREAGGGYWFGRNLDYMNFGGLIHETSLLVRVEPEDGYRYVSVSFAGLLGVLSAMNEEGLTATVLEISGPSNAAGTPYLARYAEVVRRAATVAEAIAVLERQRITTSNVLLLADRHGAMAAVEQTIAGLAVRSPRVAPHRLAQTNHFHLPAMQRWERPGLWPLNSKPLMTLLGSPRTSEDRYLTLYNRIARAERIEPQDVVDLLNATHLGPLTLQGMIFEPAAQALSAAFGAPPATERAWLRLDRALLFGAEPPVLARGQ